MKSFRCTICGEVHIGDKRPSNCPFCGVAERYIMDFENVKGEGLFTVKSLSDESRKNLMVALNLETSNASFYKCASEKSESENMRALFKRLAKVEREHADTIRKYLDLDKIEFNNEECSDLDQMNVEDAMGREKSALEFYRNSAKEAKEPKISNFFMAISEVEEGHLKVLKKSEN
uniref:Ferritin n=1 Tax=candidate division CPR3 bacterium TaxID=2268181 RepID=A0A7C4M2H3_UNCC3